MKIIITLLLLFILYAVLGRPRGIEVRKDILYSPKVKKDRKFAVISDLHNRLYGDRQERLVSKIEEEKPDFIVLLGDIFDNTGNKENAFTLLEELKGYPIYYVLGNHEYRIFALREDIERIKQLGVHVLLDDCTFFEEDIEIIGLKDYLKYIPNENVDSIVKMIKNLKKEECFSILLSHRPHYCNLYEKLDVDLIMSGHAHGGQWRIPFLNIPIFASDQGLFPRLTDGIKEYAHTKHYISRGLASGRIYLPRLFNNPEIGIVIVKKQ
ncbi:MAG: metallophosphoesterase [Solobacterium sp.]|nr:metallophosphoesterase [Solobacterium sp.]